MINTQKFILFFTLITIILALRQSDSGINDWSRENIGKINQIRFPTASSQLDQSKVVRQYKNIFYLSQLGMFGQLNRKNGQIVTRQILGQQQKIIDSDQKQLVILTSNGQIVRYNKQTMQRTVDNRLFSKQYKNIHSYVKTNTRVFVGDSKNIGEYDSSIRKIEQISSIAAPSDSIYLKIFAQNKEETSTLYALTYTQQKQEVCVNQVVAKGLVEKTCMKSVIGNAPYVKIYEDTGNIYFGDDTRHYYINYLNSKSQQFNSKPVSFSSSAVRFQNGLTFSSNFLEQSIISVESNRHGKKYIGQIQSQSLIIFQQNEGGKGQKIATLNLKNKQSRVSNVWVNFLSSSQTQVIVQFEDLELAMFVQQGRQHQSLWSRQQSLAYVDKVLFMKYEGYADHLNNPYHMKMDDPQYLKLSFVQKITQIPANLVKRVKCQIQDIYIWIIQKIQGITTTLTNPDKLKQLFNVKNYIKSSMSEDNQKKYGLQKYIIIITKYSTMFALDTKTSSILWKKKQPFDHKLISLIKLKQQYEKQIAIAITYNYHITYLNQIHQDGSLTLLEEYQTLSEPSVHKLSPHSVLLRANERVHRYDADKGLVGLGLEKQYNFYAAEGGQVRGYRVLGEAVVPTWGIQFPGNESLVTTAAVYRGQPQANLPLVNQKKVLFKNVDFSNIAVLTLQQYLQQTPQGSKLAHRLHIYIINGVTGTIQFSEYQTGVNYKLPINLVFDEHNAIVTYYNTRNRVYQIWTIEAFQLPQQSQLLSKKYQPHTQKDDIVFRSRVYGTVLPIKHVFISQSKQALLKRNLLLITRQNKVYLLPRQFTSTRRPKTSDAEQTATSQQSQFITSKYPPQQYMLPLNTLGYLNHNKQLSSLTSIRFSSSDLESTIFILCYGVDVFLIRMAPDRAFDMLADGFNYLQLVAIMIAVTVVTVFFRGRVREGKIAKMHIQ